MKSAAIALIMIAGCAKHRVVLLPPDLVVKGDREFVNSVDMQMTQWGDGGLYGDDKFALLERAEMATVKADIEMTRRVTDKEEFFSYVNKLHDDWDALTELDERLHRNSVI